MGSWKIIAISLPRCVSSCLGSMPMRLMSPIMARPEARPFLARRPMMARKAWLLPEPDSPTTASVSPSDSEKFIARTACTSLWCNSNVTDMSSTLRTSFILAILGVQGVAQPVADIGQAEQQADQHHSGPDQHPGQRLRHRRAEADQRAQRRLRFLHAEAQIGKETLHEDDLGNGQGGIDHHRAGQVGHDMAEDDRQRFGAAGLGRLDEFALL